MSVNDDHGERATNSRFFSRSLLQGNTWKEAQESSTVLCTALKRSTQLGCRTPDGHEAVEDPGSLLGSDERSTRASHHCVKPPSTVA